MTTETAMQQVPLLDVYESPLNPRRTFDPKKIEELAQSIRSHGILTPLLMRRVSRNGKGLGYEIAAGHRRFRAAQAAGLQAVPAVVRDMEDAEFLEVLTIENLQREDLHPLEEAAGYQALLKLPEYDIAGLAAKVAKSQTYIYQRLKLLELIPPARKLFLDGTITAAHAVHLARLQPADQKQALQSWVLHRGDHVASAAELARWIAEEFHADLHSAPWQKDDATLVPTAGACTTCPKRSGFTPALFPDLAKKDTCTDRACFQGKRVAFLAQKEKELQAAHPAMVRITTEYFHRQPDRKGVLTRDQYWPAKKTDPEAKLALITDGARIGTTIYVTTKRPNHSGSSTDDSWKVEQRKRDAKRAQETVRRRRIFDAIRAKLPAELTTGALRALAQGYVEEMRYDTAKPLLQAWGLTMPARKEGTHDVRGALTRAIGTMANDALVPFLQVLPLVGELVVGSYDDSTAKRLLAAAARHGVDVAAIDRQLAAERKAKAVPKKPVKKAAGDVRRAKAAKRRKAVAA